MTLRETLLLAIEASESGRPGAAVQILRALVSAVDEGKKDHFFSHFNTAESIVNFAQDRAFEQENILKAKAAVDTDGNNAA